MNQSQISSKQLFHVRKNCRLCGSTSVAEVADLGAMPIATPNFRVSDATRDDPVFRLAVPLQLFLCEACGHLQILHVGNPEIQYPLYVYMTSMSLGLLEHFRGMAVGSSRVDLQACKLEYSIVSPK